MNPPKGIFNLIRWAVGGPFRVAARWGSAAAFFCKQSAESLCLTFNRAMRGTPNAEYLWKHYNGGLLPEVKEGIICIFDGTLYHGGPTDRLRGVLTSYAEARRRGLPFYLSWTDPFELTDYYQPAAVDWRIRPEELSRSRRQSFPVLIEDLTDFYSAMRLRAGLISRKPQVHLFTNADNSRGHYRELFHELFRPSPALVAAVAPHRRELGEVYDAFTFRFLSLLGDFKDWAGETLDAVGARELMERNGRELMSLIEAIPDNRRILVTSDSVSFLKYVAPLSPRIYVVPGDVKNIDLLAGESHPDAWMKTFVDQQLLMGASRVTLMRTGRMFRSGFPRFAAEVGGAEFIYHEF